MVQSCVCHPSVFGWLLKTIRRQPDSVIAGPTDYLFTGAEGPLIGALTNSLLTSGRVAFMGKRGLRMACAWEPRVKNSARHMRARVARFIIAIFIVHQTCQPRQCNSYVGHGPKRVFPGERRSEYASPPTERRPSRVAGQDLTLGPRSHLQSPYRAPSQRPVAALPFSPQSEERLLFSSNF